MSDLVKTSGFLVYYSGPNNCQYYFGEFLVINICSIMGPKTPIIIIEAPTLARFLQPLCPHNKLATPAGGVVDLGVRLVCALQIVFEDSSYIKLHGKIPPLLVGHTKQRRVLCSTCWSVNLGLEEHSSNTCSSMSTSGPSSYWASC